NSLQVTVKQAVFGATISGLDFNTPGQPYTLSLSASEPAGDTVTGWTINWGDGTTQTVAGNSSSVTHTFALTCATYTITASAAGNFGIQEANALQVSAEFATANQCFVAQVYVDLLGRFVDPLGLAFWGGSLDAGRSRTWAVQGIEQSQEYRTRLLDGL